MRKTVNYEAIKNNYQVVKSLANKQIIAVLKNNGYNTDLLKCAKAVYDQGCRLVMVTNVEEAIIIKQSLPQLDVLIANILTEQDFQQIANYKFELMVDDLDYITTYYPYLKNHNWQLKVNIGMNRFGFDQQQEVITVINNYSNHITGLYSHVSLEDEDKELYNQQIDKFISYYSLFKSTPKYVHIENSATLQKHDSRLSICNYARVGILLFGYNNLDLQPVVSLSCKVVKIRKYDKTDTFSYGLENTVKAGITIATIDIGYGDGVLDSRKELPFYIKNIAYYQTGKQSMSHTYLIVDDNIKLHDTVEVYGTNLSLQAHAKIEKCPCSRLMSYLN